MIRAISLFACVSITVTEAMGQENHALQAIADCDRLAALPFLEHNPSDVLGRETIPEEDQTLAVEACSVAAEKFPDDTRHQFNLGRALLYQDRALEACQVFETAGSSRGNRAALSMYAYCLVDGPEVIRDRKKGFEIIRPLAEGNHAFSQFSLSSYYRINTEIWLKSELEEIRWLEQAAENKYPPAMTDLAREYLTGEKVNRDWQKSLDLLIEAADLGDGEAQWRAAEWLVSHRHAVPNCERAREYAELASENPRSSEARKKDGLKALELVADTCPESSSISVGDVQREFERLGLYEGIDEKWGPATRRAARAVQKHFGIPDTGEFVDIVNIYPRIRAFRGSIDYCRWLFESSSKTDPLALGLKLMNCEIGDR